MDKVELIRHEIEKRRVHNLAIGNPLFAVMAEEDIELLSFIDSLQEEPISEGLEEAIGKYCSNPDNFATWIGGKANDDIPLIIKAIKFGAQWQKEKTLKESEDAIQYVKENHSPSEVSDFQNAMNIAVMKAFDAGKEKMREQIMRDATEVEVKVDAGGYSYIPQMELYDYNKDMPLAKEGDKYKVILIKED